MKKYTVPQNILELTRSCDSDFSCLKTGEYQGPDGCEVDSLYGNNILFLKSLEHYHSCSYRTHFHNRQMCLCPTKFNCYIQQQEEDVIFKQCGNCFNAWGDYRDFLSDPHISLLGYQVSFVDLEAGLFLFNHLSCNNTLAIPAGNFSHLYNGPIFKVRATGSEKCPGYCLNEKEVRPCPAECECAYVRKVLQIVEEWPKASS